jgi:lysophospholipase L1-like esterase
MKTISFIASLATAMLALTSFTAFAQTSSLPELVARNGLPNFFAKASTNREVRVAYLGGSITAAGGWRPYSLAWLAKKYPKAHFREINAAVSGTGSNLGAYRLQADVLRYKPDLLFVEFASNDGPANPEETIRAMEGIVRQTWKADPNTDICFIYTVRAAEVAALEQGQRTVASAAMEKVANQYHIPSINFGVSVAEMVKENKLIFTGKLSDSTDKKIVFSGDGIHPFAETGHLLYLAILQRSFLAMESVGKPKANLLPQPMSDSNLESAQAIPLAEITKSGSWHKVDVKDDSQQMARTLPVVWKGDKTGDSFTFRFRGDNFGLLGAKGPDEGNFGITIDNGKEIVDSLLDSFSTTGRYRMRPWISPLLARGEHVVTVRVLGTMPDKQKILGAQAFAALTSEEAKGSAVYLGEILINGDLVGQKESK